MKAIRFRDLAIGQTFDFIDDSQPGHTSFTRRVEKTSQRKYRTIQPPYMGYQVGSINAQVFHVDRQPVQNGMP